MRGRVSAGTVSERSERTARGNEQQRRAESAAHDQQADEEPCGSHRFTKVSRTAASASAATLSAATASDQAGRERSVCAPGGTARARASRRRARPGRAAAPPAPSACRRRRSSRRPRSRSPRPRPPSSTSPDPRSDPVDGPGFARCARSRTATGRSSSRPPTASSARRLWKKIWAATAGRAGSPANGNASQRARVGCERHVHGERDAHRPRASARRRSRAASLTVLATFGFATPGSSLAIAGRGSVTDACARGRRPSAGVVSISSVAILIAAALRGSPAPAPGPPRRLGRACRCRGRAGAAPAPAARAARPRSACSSRSGALACRDVVAATSSSRPAIAGIAASTRCASPDAVLGRGQHPGDVRRRRGRTPGRRRGRACRSRSRSARAPRARRAAISPGSSAVERRCELGTAGEDAQAVPAGRVRCRRQLSRRRRAGRPARGSECGTSTPAKAASPPLGPPVSATSTGSARCRAAASAIR